MNEQTYTIIVNASEKQWGEHKISYEQVVVLAFGSYTDDPNAPYIVSYYKKEDKKHEFSLVKGQEAPVKDGMIFNVSQTNKS